MEKTLGSRIRTFRDHLGISQDDLARRAGIEPLLLRSIESNEVYPALGLLVKLSRALGQRLGTFLDDHFQKDPLIIRQEARQETLALHKGSASEPYRYFPLGKGKTDRHMEPFFIEIEPGSQKESSSHEGEEFLAVISGELEFTYGDQRHQLKAGDSVYYNSIVPHAVGALGDTKAELYAVVFMPF